MSEDTTFTRHVFEIIHNNVMVQTFEGQELSGVQLVRKIGGELAKYIDILDGLDLSAIHATASSLSKTGGQFFPREVFQAAGVSIVTQEKVTGVEVSAREKTNTALSQYNLMSASGKLVEQKDLSVFSQELGFTFIPDKGPYDYIDEMTQTAKDNSAANSILVMSPVKMELNDLYYGIATAGNFAALADKRMEMANKKRASVKGGTAGAFYDLYVNARGLESDPNTLSYKIIIGYFSAVCATLYGQCSECKYYVGPNASGIDAGDSQVINAALSCKFGYTDPGGKAKGPDSSCQSDEITAVNSTSTGIKYAINKETSDLIRERQKTISKDGYDGYTSITAGMSNKVQ